MIRCEKYTSSACVAILLMAAHARAQDPYDTEMSATRPSEPQPGSGGLFTDPEDGAFDISNFLSTRTGFLPIVMPITEPAVGYGAGAGLLFFHTRPRVVHTPDGERVIPPNVTAVFGMATENGSWAGGAAHLHTWNGGRVRGAGFRYLIARQYDLRLGCDVARGPEDWAFYVTIGTGWLRD